MRQGIFWQAFVGLLCFDLMLSLRDFATVHRIVRRWEVAEPRRTDARLITRICDAVNYACIWYPKRVLCLQRSAVTTCILRSHGIDAQWALGAQRLPFKAHAWVEVDGKPINERVDVQSIYTLWEKS